MGPRLNIQHWIKSTLYVVVNVEAPPPPHPHPPNTHITGLISHLSYTSRLFLNPLLPWPYSIPNDEQQQKYFLKMHDQSYFIWNRRWVRESVADSILTNRKKFQKIT